jgi:hypothetical protein
MEGGLKVLLFLALSGFAPAEYRLTELGGASCALYDARSRRLPPDAQEQATNAVCLVEEQARPASVWRTRTVCVVPLQGGAVIPTKVECFKLTKQLGGMD